MARCGRITANPLLRVQKAETRGYERVVRRAYTLDELRRLAGGIRGMPSHTIFNADLERTGNAKHDERGRSVDFRSFRMTFTTFPQVAGIDRRVVMEVARHKDSRLTELVYTDVERLDLRSTGCRSSVPKSRAER